MAERGMSCDERGKKIRHTNAQVSLENMCKCSGSLRKTRRDGDQQENPQTSSAPYTRLRKHQLQEESQGNSKGKTRLQRSKVTKKTPVSTVPKVRLQKHKLHDQTKTPPTGKARLKSEKIRDCTKVSSGKTQLKDKTKSQLSASSSSNEEEGTATAMYLYDLDIKMKDSPLLGRTYNHFALLPGDRLVTTDWSNSKIKLFDMKRHAVVSVLQTPSEPWEITLITDDLVAVTLPFSRLILFVKVRNDLQIEREMVVKGFCRGIAYGGGKLIVIIDDPHVKAIEVMSLDGVVERRIENKLFKWLLHVDVSPDGKIIYVTDFIQYTVTRLDLDLDLDGDLVQFKDGFLRQPAGLAVDKLGRIFVCGVTSGNIYLLNSDCTKLAVVAENVHKPSCISYCEKTDRLYVGRHGGGSIAVFQMNW